VKTRFYFCQSLITEITLFGLIIVFLLVNIGSIRYKSFTTDEAKHYRYGENILHLDSDRFDDSKMPFSVLNVLPAKIASLVPEGIVNRYLQKEQTGRVVTMLFSVGIACLVFHWSRSLYGVIPGFLTMVLFIFDPNILAHSRLNTTDIYATGMAVLTIYTFWLFSKHRSWKYATLSSATLGVSQLAKYTSVFLYFILVLIVVVRDFRQWYKVVRSRDILKVWGCLKKGTVTLLFFLLISILIINIGFLFNKTFTPLKDYTFRSQLFQTIQTKLTPFGFLPIPTPYPFLEGLDWVQARERSGIGYDHLYLLGELRHAEGFKGYYIIASFLKMPIATQVIVLISIGVYIINCKDYNFIENEVFLFVPFFFFFYYFNFIFRPQIGIRFYLVVFPFLYVFAGSLVRNWLNFKPVAKYTLGGLLIYLIGSVLGAYPHYIPYFNELVWDQKDAYQYLADSNLDWDQAEWIRDQYLEDHPDIVLEPSRPTLGRIMVSPNNLVGINGDRDRYAWLLDNLQPVDIIADVYLIYEITEEDYRLIRNQHRE